MTALIIIILLIIINIFTVYRFLFNIIFDSVNEFNESFRYSLTPDIFSLFRGEYWKDRMGELKFEMFIGLCIIATAIEFLIVNGILQRII